MSDEKMLETKYLGYILSDIQYMHEAIAKMKPEYFVYINNIFRSARAYYNKYHGVITDDAFARLLEHRNTPASDMLALQTIMSEARTYEPIDKADYQATADEIVNLYRRRGILDMGKLIASDNPMKLDEAEYEALITQITQKMQSISSAGVDVYREGTIANDAQERLETYERIKNNPEELNLVSTGYKQIDASIIGWGYGSANYVVGRKGDGKSTLLLNFAYHVWRNGHNVLLFSLEIDKAQYERRFDARAALLPSMGLKAGTLDEREEGIYKRYIEALKKGEDLMGNKVGQMYIVDCPAKVTPAYISAKTKEIEGKNKTCYDVVIIDYFGIMSPTNPTKVARDDLGQMSLELKQFARENNKILLSALQMNRAGVNEADSKKSTSTMAIADSDSIANHADNIFVIRSVDEQTAVLESIKTRDGAHFKFTVEKMYDKMCVREIENDKWSDF